MDNLNKRIEYFLSNNSGVMLDALAYYLKTTEQRKKDLMQLKVKYEERLDYHVVMAQLDTNMIDMRDETCITLELIAKKLESFEEYSKAAENLYGELFTYLKSKR